MISIVVLMLPQAPRSSVQDAITQRLQRLFGAAATGDTIAQTRAFYDRLVDAAAIQRITVEESVLATDYASLKYDYMSGYVAIFFLAAIGLAITFAFARLEKRGFIRKLGVEEAEGIQSGSIISGPHKPGFFSRGGAFRAKGTLYARLCRMEIHRDFNWNCDLYIWIKRIRDSALSADRRHANNGPKSFG